MIHTPGMIYTKQIMFFYHAYEEVKMNPNSSWKNVLENEQILSLLIQLEAKREVMFSYLRWQDLIASEISQLHNCYMSVTTFIITIPPGFGRRNKNDYQTISCPSSIQRR